MVVLAGAGTAIWFGTRSSSSAAAGIVTTTKVQAVTTGTVSQTVAATGTIEPTTTADLNFAVSGTVTAVNVVAGQVVTAGQALATVDPTALERQPSLRPRPPWPTTRPSWPPTRAAFGSSAHPDRAPQRQHRLGPEPGERRPRGLCTNATLVSTTAGTVASLDLVVGQQVLGLVGKLVDVGHICYVGIGEFRVPVPSG